MLVSPDHRIFLSAQPAPAAIAPALEPVFVGQAAASPAFSAAAEAVAAAAQLGFAPEQNDTSLNNLPLAFTDIGSFAAAFPGDAGWLARAVRDFFAAGGQRAWVVRAVVDPAAPLDAYLDPNPLIVAARSPGAIAIATQVPSAGLLVLPDLEFACLAAALPRPAPPVPPAAPPAFRPLADYIIAPASAPAAAPAPPSPITPHDVLTRVSAWLAAQRPDMLCLFALPVGADPTQSAPALVQRAIAYVHGADGADMPLVQAFAPLVRDGGGAIATPSGLLAGLLCAVGQNEGVWRSLAGRQLPLGVTPLRRIESNGLARLRQGGIAALRFVQGGTILDDDLLACRQGLPGSAQRRSAGTRRLFGWLIRNLRSFGEQLVFENVMNDGRVELVLTSLFADLFKRGALTGGQVSDAVRITRRDLGVRNAYAFDIAVATTVAVETIRLQFVDGTLTTSLGVPLGAAA